MNSFMKFSLLLKRDCIIKIETEKQISVPKIFVHLMVEEMFLNFLFSTLLFFFFFFNCLAKNFSILKGLLEYIFSDHSWSVFLCPVFAWNGK